MRIDEFLRTVITTPEGHFCLATRDAEGSAAWKEHFYSWPNDSASIVAHALEAAQKNNVYFSAHLFNERNSRKAAVLPSRTIQADLDHAEVATLPLIPNIVVNTSPSRHQAYWITQYELEVDKLEALSRRIAYGVSNCDRTGWPAGHKVRLPDTYNYKYKDPNKIEVTGVNLRELALDAFNLFPESTINLAAAQADVAWLDEDFPEFELSHLELLVGLKPHLSAKVYTQYTKEGRDRSASLWALVCEVFRAGCTRDQVLYLAYHSANNKFADRKYNGLRDLKQDILRAERVIVSKQIDLKALVMDLRHGKDHVIIRRKKIADVVINNMRETGEFVHCKGGMLYWLRRDTGRPIVIASHSEWLNAYLSQSVGLNSTEQEHRFVVQELIAFARNLPTSDDLVNLSFYQPKRTVLMIHTGGRDVLHIYKDRVELHPNGYGSTVFQWTNAFEMFSYSTETLDVELGRVAQESESGDILAWHEALFKGMLYNTVGLTRLEVLVVLRTYILFLLFRAGATTRPILALYGQPGSTKTTIAKLLYRLIYGYYKSISGISTTDDFDMAVSSQPFVCFDNLDTWFQWLPDKLALCAGDSDIEKRKLYTDMDTVLVKRQALVAISAHNPKFSREDITDRLLLLMFQRLDKFGSDSYLCDRISTLRAALWASLVQDIQRILSTPKPPVEDAPQFRIEDFAHLGYWFSIAHSQEYARVFTSAINKIQGRQRSFNLEEDQMLVNAITRYLDKRDATREATFDPCATWWERLSTCAQEPDIFRKHYRNALTLSKKLWVIQNSLKSILDVEWMDDRKVGARTWKITKRVES